jgi:orotidine-5'-phosphate decarboxylase
MMNDRDAIARRIMIALDVAEADAARTLLRRLEGIPCWMKVGMELFYAEGPAFVRELRRSGYAVFLDLKLHDIPNTVRGAARSITRLGVDMFNVHAAGGARMMEAALAGANEALEETAAPRRPLIIAVTQLTSTDQKTLNEQIGIPGSVESAVLRYAELARLAGLDGVVASPLEVERIKESQGRQFLTVTPGIRPAGAAAGDQVRVMTPAEAFAAGTDFIVVGRPVTAAPDPRRALLDIIDSAARHA